MNLEMILTFLTITETGNISSASEKLYISQATASQRLKKLEEELGGAELIERHRGYKNATLTEKGRAFVPIAEKMLGLLQESRRLEHICARPFLQIGSTDSLAVYMLGDFFSRLIRNTPDTDYTLMIKDSVDIFRLVNIRALDVGIVLDSIKDDNIRTEKLAEEKMVLVTRDPAFKDRDVIRTVELDRSRLIYQYWNKKYQAWFDTQFDSTIRNRISVNTISLLRSAMSEEKAFAIVPCSIAKYLHQDGFSMKELAPAPPNREIFFITKKDLAPGQAELIQDFYQRLRSFMNEQTLT